MQNIEQARVKILHFNGLAYHRALAVVDVGNLIRLDEGRTLCHAGDAPTIASCCRADKTRLIALARSEFEELLGVQHTIWLL
jgi:hypothetical protein